MRKETVDEDSSEQILQSFRILAEDKVSTITVVYLLICANLVLVGNT